MKTLPKQSKPDPEFEKQRAALLGEVYAWLLERRRRRLEQEQKSTNEQGKEAINDNRPGDGEDKTKPEPAA